MTDNHFIVKPSDVDSLVNSLADTIMIEWVRKLQPSKEKQKTEGKI